MSRKSADTLTGEDGKQTQRPGVDQADGVDGVRYTRDRHEGDRHGAGQIDRRGAPRKACDVESARRPRRARATRRADSNIKRFRDLISEVAGLPETATDHSGLSNEELIVLMADVESIVRQLIMEILGTAYGDWPEVYRQAALTGYGVLDPKTLLELHKQGAPEVTLRYLVQLGLQLRPIYREFVSRQGRFPLGQAMLNIGAGPGGDSPGSALDPLIKQLGIAFRRQARRLRLKQSPDYFRSSRPHKESDDDLRSRAFEAAWRGFQDMGDEETERPNLPDRIPWERPRDLPASRVSWDWERFRAGERKEALRLYLPVLDGKVEGLSEKARQSLRGIFELWGAREEQAPETPFIEDVAEMTREAGGEGVNRAIGPDQELAGAHSFGVDGVLDLRKAYEWAEEQYPGVGRRFVMALAENGGDVAAASKAVGVSRNTGHKYRRTLQRYRDRNR